MILPLSASLAFLILISVLTTSVISGVFGMVGGMILMGIYASIFSVTTAMILHGVAQLASNGSRMILYWKHVLWRPVAFYVVGSLAAMGVFFAITLVPSKSAVFLILGSLPFLTAIPHLPALDIRRAPDATLCGVLVTAAQLTGGATGPLLDVFYVRNLMNRYQIMGTKAVTQSIGHFQKTAYFAALLLLESKGSFDLPLWILAASVAMAALGAAIGKRVIARLTDHQFQRYSQRIIMLVGGAYLIRGITGLVQGY